MKTHREVTQKHEENQVGEKSIVDDGNKNTSKIVSIENRIETTTNSNIDIQDADTTINDESIDEESDTSEFFSKDEECKCFNLYQKI